MKERPILFSGEMVRAILDGRKIQTRRVVRNQPPPDIGLIHVSHYHPTVIDQHGEEAPGAEIFGAYSDDGYWGCKSPFGEPCDHLWVRETHFAYGRWETRYSPKKGRDEWHFIDMTVECDRNYQYTADSPAIPLANNRRGVTPGWWERPAIFMPHAASRITLAVTCVRVERLQEISEADARAEGAHSVDPVTGHECILDTGMGSYLLHYRDIWEQIYGAGSWDANPWVWVISFQRIKP